MLAGEAYRCLAEEVWQDETVVCSLGTTANEWWRQTKSDDCFYMNSSMGLAASFGLGLSLAAPDLKVWVLDSDGALCMNLGSLLTEAAQRPSNMIHFLLSNGCYQAIGGSPLVNTGLTDWAALARAAGIENVVYISSVEEVIANAKMLQNTTEYTFVILEVDGIAGEKEPLRIPFEGPEMKYRFGRNLQSRANISVFGPYGY
jgi:thiamine pyrophosphate-dependent acetolactate synthase large subunit-like protein